jgi:hypothetical protein
MMSPSMWPIWSNVKFFIFFRKFYKVHSIEVYNQDYCQQNAFWLTHNYKYGVKIWATCTQVDLEVICKTSQTKKEDHLIFINFGVKNFTIKKAQKNKTLMFKWGAEFFWDWFLTRYLKILQLLFLILILLFFEKSIFPTTWKIAKFDKCIFFRGLRQERNYLHIRIPPV